ncbi:YceI family protein [Helicobacter marmotae]|uniref:Lipid/polyisoprenoid-binding YceI-like domain-containing protein n=1 Tax=Helicobacter marmotae TaxID=152490 RepID=A0A3D8I7P2_9HELI|nr:YceI family protein [Helicobacter marmotae]RDU61169.1 hypothetical protein CQA63_01295 [Helicobacter marmotae]
MTKIIASLALVGSMVCAATIDSANAKVKWTAFKTPEKVAVSGTFDEVKFKFGTPNKTQSLESQLNNATATINANSVNLDDEGKNETVRTFFFAKFKKQEPIKVTFKEVIEGKNTGTILASVRMNGKTDKVPMQFEVANKKLVAKGVIDLSQFGAEEARLSLQENAPHDGLTWSQVEIALEAPLK